MSVREAKWKQKDLDTKYILIMNGIYIDLFSKPFYILKYSYITHWKKVSKLENGKIYILLCPQIPSKSHQL